MDFSIGSATCAVRLTIAHTKGKIGVNLYIPDDKDLFHKLAEDKEQIEKTVGAALEWHELPERKASRITIEKAVDIYDHNDWNNQLKWLTDYAVKFKRAFANRL